MSVLTRLFGAVRKIPLVRRFIWRRWYQYLANVHQDQNWTLMNYGFAHLESEAAELELDPARESERYSLQLYHQVAGEVDLNGKDVLEVGCGWGGGAAYIYRYLKPKSVIGVDFSANAVELSNKIHAHDGLSFEVGDAESLPFENNSFDAVINVESSHCYGSMEAFLSEVALVLRPNGYFLFADFRHGDDVKTLRRQLSDSGLRILEEKDISLNVLKALEVDQERKIAMVKSSVPRFLAKSALDFAGVKGSRIWRRLESGKTQYLQAVLQKAVS